MFSTWTSKQDGLVRFPSGSGCLKLEFPRGTKSHARALRDLALESGDARTSIVYFRRAWLRFVRSPKSRWVVITASPTLLTWSGESLGISMAHSEATAERDIVADELAVIDDRDGSEILREDIQIVRGRQHESAFEFAREAGVALHRILLGLAAGDEFLIEIDLMVGAVFGKGESLQETTAS